MSQVTFYLMSEQDDAQASAVERLACQLVADSWGAGHLYLLCDDEAQALRLDELLWQLPPERFVPHQLQARAVRHRWRSAISRHGGVMPASSIWPNRHLCLQDTSLKW